MKWENFTYALEMSINHSPPADAGLTVLRAFLQEPEDVLLVDTLLTYKVPMFFTVRTFLNSKSFLCITIFPGTVKKGADSQKWLQTLVPYGKLLSKRCTLPHLPTLLFNGAEHELDWLTIYRNADESDIGKIIEDALLTPDIFVINGRELSRIFAQIVQRLIGVTQGKTFTIEEYKKRLSKKIHTDTRVLDLAATLSKRFENSAFTRTVALEELEIFYMEALPLLSKGLLTKINESMDELRLSPKTSDMTLQRILRSLYALPQNITAYEDNGTTVINEAIVRLSSYDKCPPGYLSELKTLANSYDSSNGSNGSSDDSSKWLEQLTAIRNKLLIALTPSKDVYISGTQRHKITTSLNESIQELSAYTKQASNQKNAILNDYIKKINPTILDKYTNPTNINRPFVHKGIAVIDMDTCEPEITETIATAKKIILLGSQNRDLFLLFLQAAWLQQQKDGQKRVALFGANV